MEEVKAAKENVQPSTPPFAHLEFVQTTQRIANTILTRSMWRKNQGTYVFHACLQVLSNGVLVQDVLLSNTRVVASIQNVIRRRLSNATISNTSQVIRNDSLKNGELLLFQAELVLFLVACPMAIGVVKCRRSPFLEHLSLMKMLSP